MLSTYEEYRSQPMSLTFDEMVSLHGEMAAEVGKDPEALGLYEDLPALAVRYADVRAHWPLWDREKRGRRTRPAPRATIRSLSPLTHWRGTLGEESENPYYRKRIGDFACYPAFMEGLGAR